MKMPTSGKRVYRNLDNAVVAGVCSGVAKYLDVDAIWVRGAAVIAMLMMPAVTLLAYLAAVFLLPRWSL